MVLRGREWAVMVWWGLVVYGEKWLTWVVLSVVPTGSIDLGWRAAGALEVLVAGE